MTTKKVWAVVLYLAAIVVPAGAIAARFGFNTDVDLSSSGAALDQAISVGAALIVGVVVGLFASRLLARDADSMVGFIYRLGSGPQRHRKATEQATEH